MQRLSMMRFRECMRIEDTRAGLMDEMHRLIESYEHLKGNPATPENALAMKETLSTIGRLENENKELCEKSDELWREVLDLDGHELTSRVILKEKIEVQRGIEWLERVVKRMARDLGCEESAVMAVSEVRGELNRLHSELTASQERYQWAYAETIAKSKWLVE